MMNADPRGRRVDTQPLRAGAATSLSMLDRLRARDGAAWTAFVSLYAPLVVRWCHRQGLRETDVADIAQEVFRRVAQDLPRFVKEAVSDSFRGWLCRITHRQIAEFFRSRDRALQAEGGSDANSWLQRLPDRPCDEPGPEESKQEERFLYQKAIELTRSEFSDRHWQMFWRVVVDGSPVSAVAAEFETTSAAVLQAKSRVLRRLRQVVGAPDAAQRVAPEFSDR